LPAERITRCSPVGNPVAVPSQCVIALVEAGRSFTDNGSNLELIGRLHTGGVIVIAYADGASSWPLARRCRVLLSGCSCLLDSASNEFPHELRRTLDHGFRKLEEAFADDQRLRDAMSAHGVVGGSRATLTLFSSALKIAALSDLPTLITGESGTGKDLLARAIHERDPKRRTGPFVALNCGAISATLAETELFGHLRGAFTGAERDRKGLFRAAHGGVLFLDEVAELDLDVQVKLLRVLQDSRVLSVGGDHDAPVSVRVIAATNADLRDLVAQRRFRADLFHRLNVVPIHIPPLRERREDIRPLVDHFVRRHHSLNPIASSSARAEFVDALERLPLPGNARQVENLVRFALVHNDGTVPLGLPDLPSEVWQQLADETSAPPAPDVIAEKSLGLLEANGWNLSRTLEACERSFVQAAFYSSEGNQSKTARLLGITPRSVYNKLRRHRLA
jgi:transcriptional regulator with GAF, ATPase, and Fis domain